MGYPMTYDRVVNRNMLSGDYNAEGPNSLVKGDLRRLERDAQDDEHIRSYAHHSGATEAQVRLIFKMFFEGPWPNWRDANPPRWQRECVHQVSNVMPLNEALESYFASDGYSAVTGGLGIPNDMLARARSVAQYAFVAGRESAGIPPDETKLQRVTDGRDGIPETPERDKRWMKVPSERDAMNGSQFVAGKKS